MITNNIIAHANVSHHIWHEVKSRTSIAFQNLLIDEQYVIAAVPNGTAVETPQLDGYLAGDNNTYASGAIIFVPNDGAEIDPENIKADIIASMMEFINSSEMTEYRTDGLAYVAFRTTKSGLWVFISDASPDSDQFISYLIDDLDSANPTDAWTNYGDEPIAVDINTLYTTGTPEECSGPDFCNALGRERNAIVTLMQREGLFTTEVNFEIKEDE